MGFKYAPCSLRLVIRPVVIFTRQHEANSEQTVGSYSYSHQQENLRQSGLVLCNDLIFSRTDKSPPNQTSHATPDSSVKQKSFFAESRGEWTRVHSSSNKVMKTKSILAISDCVFHPHEPCLPQLDEPHASSDDGSDAAFPWWDALSKASNE